MQRVSSEDTNPLGKIETFFWEIGRLSALYFLTLFALLVSPRKVVESAAQQDPAVRPRYCPPVILMLLTLALFVAMVKYVFFKQSFDILESTGIFRSFLTHTGTPEALVDIWLAAVSFPVAAAVLLLTCGRVPSFDLVSKATRLLLYYWSSIFFWTLLSFAVFLWVMRLDWGMTTVELFSFVMWTGLCVIFAQPLKSITNRPYWLAILSMVLTQFVLPMAIISATSDNSYHWTLQRKFKDADVVAVVTVLNVQPETPWVFDRYTIEGTALLGWEDIWKGRDTLHGQEILQSSIGLVVPMRGRSAELTIGRYLVFLQRLDGRLLPLDGSPVAFYKIDDHETLEPLGHKVGYRREDKLVKSERIALKDAKRLVSNLNRHE